MTKFVAILLTVLLALPASCAQAEPRSAPLMQRVDDQAGLLGESAEQRISRRLEELERRTTDQVAVKTVNSLEGRTIEAFSLKMANDMRLGTAENDNGVLVIVAPQEKKVRIESGCGMAGVLTDAEAELIVKEMVGHFRNGAFEQGIERGVESVDRELSEHPTGPLRLIRDKRCSA